MSEELSNEEKQRAKLAKAVNDAADDDGNVVIRISLTGDGRIHTGKKQGATAGQGDELTVPESTALAHTIKGWAEPVKPKATKNG